MAEGDLTASTGVVVKGGAAIKTAVDALNLAAVSDFVFVSPIDNGQHIVFKVEREGAA